MNQKTLNNHTSIKALELALREKCPNMELFLVNIFLYSYWIQENTDQK